MPVSKKHGVPWPTFVLVGLGKSLFRQSRIEQMWEPLQVMTMKLIYDTSEKINGNGETMNFVVTCFTVGTKK